MCIVLFVDQLYASGFGFGAGSPAHDAMIAHQILMHHVLIFMILYLMFHMEVIHLHYLQIVILRVLLLLVIVIIMNIPSPDHIHNNLSINPSSHPITDNSIGNGDAVLMQQIHLLSQIPYRSTIDSWPNSTKESSTTNS